MGTVVVIPEGDLRMLRDFVTDVLRIRRFMHVTSLYHPDADLRPFWESVLRQLDATVERATVS